MVDGWVRNRVEPRFSESINDGQGEAGGRRQVAVRTGSGIDELSGMGFSSLVQRMVKVSGGRVESREGGCEAVVHCCVTAVLWWTVLLACVMADVLCFQEGYLKETKDMSDPANMAKRQFTLGPRFFVEVGAREG